MKTPFKDAVVPVPNPAGDWGGTHNGVDIKDGVKGTPGIIPDMTGPVPMFKQGTKGKGIATPKPRMKY